MQSRKVVINAVWVGYSHGFSVKQSENHGQIYHMNLPGPDNKTPTERNTTQLENAVVDCDCFWGGHTADRTTRRVIGLN